jgi:type II secretory pathway component PulC
MTPSEMIDKFATKESQKQEMNAFKVSQKQVLEAFQKAVARVDELSSRFSSVQDSVVDLKEIQDKNKAALTDLQDVTKLQIEGLKFIVSDIQKKTYFLETEKARLELQIKNVVLDHNELVSQVSVLASGACTLKSELEVLKSVPAKIDSLKVETQEGIKSLTGAQESLGVKLETLSKSCASIPSRFENFEAQFDMLAVKLADCKAQVNKDSAQINNWMSALEARINAQIKALADAPQKEVSVEGFAKSSELADSIAKVSSSLESISLDAKNAYLKAGNSVTQIEMINKKLENFQLLLKSYDLNK